MSESNCGNRPRYRRAVRKPPVLPRSSGSLLISLFTNWTPHFGDCPPLKNRTAREEFAAVVNERRQGLICLSYSTVGLRPDCDLLLWRIGSTSDEFQEQTARINKTRLAWLSCPRRGRFVSMTKRSSYIDKVDPFHTAESRTHIIPGKRKYLYSSIRSLKRATGICCRWKSGRKSWTCTSKRGTNIRA